MVIKKVTTQCCSWQVFLLVGIGLLAPLFAQEPPRLTLTNDQGVNVWHEARASQQLEWHTGVPPLRCLSAKKVAHHEDRLNELCDKRSFGMVEAFLHSLPEPSLVRNDHVVLSEGYRALDNNCIDQFRLALHRAPVQEELFATFLNEAVRRHTSQPWVLEEVLARGHDISREVLDDSLAVAETLGNDDAITRLVGQPARENGQYDRWCHQQGFTLLHRALHRGKSNVVQAYVNQRKNEQAFHTALNAQDRYGRTPLYAAAVKGLDGVVDLLLQHGANPLINADFGDEDAYTICAAIDNGHAAVVQKLWPYCNAEHRRHGNKKAAFESGSSDPLLYAAYTGQVACLKVLLEHPATCVNVYQACGTEGYEPTALCHAVEKGCFESVKLLLEHGADTSVKDDEGDTPLKIAKMLKSFEERKASPDQAVLKKWDDIIALIKSYNGGDSEDESDFEESC